MMRDYIVVGIVLKAQGIRGEIKVKPLTNDIKRFDQLTELFIARSEESYEPVIITKRRYDANAVFLLFDSIEDRTKAETLKGLSLCVPREQAVVLPDDEWFMDDLIGCLVETDSKKQLGFVEDILETGSNDVFVVRGQHGEILIPVLKTVINQVDIQQQRICVNESQLEGLLPDGF
jgi:16S rRNA processing protein RimM